MPEKCLSIKMFSKYKTNQRVDEGNSKKLVIFTIIASGQPVESIDVAVAVCVILKHKELFWSLAACTPVGMG